MRALIAVIVVLPCLAILGLILWGMSQASATRPTDDWAPIEAAFGRKFLGRTARSRRRWVRDPAGREHLIEATKQDVGYVLMLDGEHVGFALPADLEGAIDRLARKVGYGDSPPN